MSKKMTILGQKTKQKKREVAGFSQKGKSDHFGGKKSTWSGRSKNYHFGKKKKKKTGGCVIVTKVQKITIFGEKKKRDVA